jgi:hypothetical protein
MKENPKGNCASWSPCGEAAIGAVNWGQEIVSMPTTKPLTLETVDFGNPAEVDAFLEQVMTAGMARVRAEIAEHKRGG